MDETVLDIATDKVDSEVPSTAEGTIAEILYHENDVVPVGQVIARITTEDDHSETVPEEQKPAAPEHEEADIVEELPYQPEEKKAANNGGSGIRFYSPLVLNIASSEGISMNELENIEGTGQDSRVSKKDIIAYLERRKSAPRQESPQLSQSPVHDVPATTATKQYAPTVYTGNVEIIEMDRMRKMIAQHMINSQNTSAHVTSFSECDVTNMVLWREKVKKDFEKEKEKKLLSLLCSWKPW